MQDVRGRKLAKVYKLMCLVPNRFPAGYWSELDMLPELLHEHVSNYQSLTGIFRWMTELGRVDIPTEVYTLSLHI